MFGRRRRLKTRQVEEPWIDLSTGQVILRRRCEVYSRVVGYLRPVHHWNPGKQQEFEDRQEYEVAPVEG